MKLYFLSLIFISSLFFISCQKEVDATIPGTPGGGSSSGSGSTGGSTTSGTYFPLTNGTWWKYKDSTTGTVSTTTVTNVKKTINGIAYTAALSGNATQSDTGWAADAKPHYYTSAIGTAAGGQGYDFTFSFLNDTASVGYNWMYNAGQGNGFTASTKTTIIAKG